MSTNRVVLVGLLAALAGCTSPNGTSGPTLPSVVATTGMIADAARIVGGPHVDVFTLMGPGIDPHQYKASAGDLARLRAAKLILYNGQHLEGKMADVFEQMKKRTKTVAVTHRLDPARDLRPAAEGYEGTHDPHVWFDVSLWIKCVEVVRDALIDLDPAHAADFRTNAEAYLKELAALHDEVKAKAATIPEGRRVLITAHDAFYYFGRAYGFEVRGLQGVSTADEASAADREELARFIADRRIPALFVESSVPEKNLKAVQESVRAKGFTVSIGGELYSDALGNPDGPAGTYIGMVRHNIDTIVEALK